MKRSGTVQSSNAGSDSIRASRLRRLISALSRREGAAFTLPLTLALLGTSLARERTELDGAQDESASGPSSNGAGSAHLVAQPGDRMALLSGDTVLAEHLLSEADVAAGQVRIALRLIDDAARLPAMSGVRATAKSEQNENANASDEQSSDAVEDVNAAEAADEAALEAGEPAGRIMLAAAESSAAAEPAAPATEDDDDDSRLIWLVVGIGAAGVAIALTNDDDDRAEDTQEPPPPPPPASNEISGEVIKGYVQGAAVYLDIDHDGLPDGDPVYTDAQGRFTFQTDETGASLLVYGGVDTLTNSPLDGLILRAPPGSTVVTPLTTLIDEMMKQDESLTASQAQARLAEALG
ncbi:MAG TPA: hypothetical protein VIL32_04260, partial [Steroidobacteraceae bacterium]